MASLSDNPPKRATTVKFVRKTSSGRYVSLSREDLDYTNYTVQMPPTPDNQPMEDEVPNESLYGGIPRPRMSSKIVESEASHFQKIAARGSACAMPDCEQVVMQDGRGYDIHP